MQMSAVMKMSNEFGDVQLGTVEMPKAKKGNVIIEAAATGVCGSDLHIFKGEYKVVPPVVIGHEVCGFVCEIAEGGDESLLGKRVVTETFFSVCETCDCCRSGKPNLCGNRRSIGTHVNGAMSRFVEVPARGLHLVPDWLSDAAASMAEPLACVTNGLIDDDYMVGPNSNVLVIGPGTIGMLAAQVARAAGARVTVRGTQKDKARLEIAEELGFAVQDGSCALDVASYDRAIDCSGSGFGVADALNALGKRGHLIELGIIGKDANLPFDQIIYKELKVTTGFASNPRSWSRAMHLIASRKIDLEVLVSEIAPLKDWDAIFRRSMAAEGLKFVFDPRL